MPDLPRLNYDRPIDIEIGCGVGLHPILYCQSNKDRQLIAIEHTKTKFDKFQRRVNSHQLENLWPVHANAISYISKHFKENSVDRFIFMYPNPNPKRSAANKRWYNMPFMEHLIGCLKPQGQLLMATNEYWYIKEAYEALSHYLVMGPIEKITKSKTHKPRTHFEKKYLLSGQTCWQIEATAPKHS